MQIAIYGHMIVVYCYILFYYYRKVLITILKSKGKACQVLEFRNEMLWIPLR